MFHIPDRVRGLVFGRGAEPEAEQYVPQRAVMVSIDVLVLEIHDSNVGDVPEALRRTVRNLPIGEGISIARVASLVVGASSGIMVRHILINGKSEDLRLLTNEKAIPTNIFVRTA